MLQTKRVRPQTYRLGPCVVKASQRIRISRRRTCSRLLSGSCSRDLVSFALQGFRFSIFDAFDRNNPPF